MTSTNAEEVAYCLHRIEQSTALASASTDMAARASHVGLAERYTVRLATLNAAASSSDLAPVRSVTSHVGPIDV